MSRLFSKGFRGSAPDGVPLRLADCAAVEASASLPDGISDDGVSPILLPSLAIGGGIKVVYHVI